MLHFRHPYELGGAYWLFNMAYTQLSIFIVLYARSTMGKMPGEETWLISSDDLQKIAITISGMWLVAILSLFKFSIKEFRHTFYQPTRGWEYNRALFDTGDNEYRMSIFTDHPQYYMWYKKDIKEWLVKVWDELYEQNPVWFSEEVVKTIPLELIPANKQQGLLEDFEESGRDTSNWQEGGLEIDREAGFRNTMGRAVRHTLGLNSPKVVKRVTLGRRSPENARDLESVNDLAAMVAADFIDEDDHDDMVLDRLRRPTVEFK